MSITAKELTMVSQTELPVLAGKLDYLKGMVDIERKVMGAESYNTISRTMEQAILDCREIAERLLLAGPQETT